MKQSELREIIQEAISEISEAIGLGVAESTPPNFPKGIKDKIFKQYGKDSPKAYATMWAIKKKLDEGDQRVKEMWMAFENKQVSEEFDPDQEEREKYDRQICRHNQKNPQRYPCPTCKKPDALSAWEKKKGYQCSACADAEEGVGGLWEGKEDLVDQLRRELRKAVKERNAEKAAYYSEALKAPIVALASFDRQFKGSAAYEQWIKKHGAEIKDQQSDIDRFAVRQSIGGSDDGEVWEEKKTNEHSEAAKKYEKDHQPEPSPDDKLFEDYSGQEKREVEIGEIVRAVASDLAKKYKIEDSPLIKKLMSLGAELAKMHGAIRYSGQMYEHTEADINNLEEKREVEIGKQILNFVKGLPAETHQELSDIQSIQALAQELIDMHHNSSGKMIEEKNQRFDVEDCEVVVNGTKYYADAIFQWDEESINHRHDPRKGQGQDLIADVPVKVDDITVTDVSGNSVTDKTIVDNVAAATLEKFRESDEGARNKRWGKWM
jgi:hypothetical protein